MANKNLLPKSKVKDFIHWLGSRAHPACGQWEIVRWFGMKGEPVRAIYKSEKNTQYVTCNDAAIFDVKEFLYNKKQKNISALDIIRKWVLFADKGSKLTVEEYDTLLRQSKNYLNKYGN